MLGKKTKETDDVTTRSPRSGPVPDRGTSVISKEMRIEGDCIVEGSVRIEGRISGNVKALGLELAESGSVEGDLTAAEGKSGRAFTIAGRVDGSVDAPRVDVVSTGSVLRGVVADEAHVRGRIEGGIVARHRLVLEETAMVEGDVRARRLALKEGGQVNGTILMGDRAGQDIGGAGGASETPPRTATGSSSVGASTTGASASEPGRDKATEKAGEATRRKAGEKGPGKGEDEQEVLAKAGAKDSEG